MGKKEGKTCGSCKYFKLLKENGYGKCSHSRAHWPNEKGFSATYSDNSPSIILDVDTKGEHVYCYKRKK